MSILMRGMHGEPVRVLQSKLGVDADGIFGAATEEALRQYQSTSDLAVDGIAGPDTFTQMGIHELVLLKRGTRGETVKKLQSALGIGADGDFGPATEKAVRAFQEANSLDVDGIAGPKTLALVDGFGDVMTEEVVAASVVTESTQPVDPAAVEAAKESEAPANESLLAKVEGKVAEVGKSIWHTVKSLF
jgi:peptidoglycan hydrolase-like protein with peptidoglycan-binding domain